MTQQNQRQYLENIPTNIQDLIYDAKRTEVIPQIMAHYRCSKPDAIVKLVQIDEKLHEAFPNATFAGPQDLTIEKRKELFTHKAIGCMGIGILFMAALGVIIFLFIDSMITKDAIARKNWPTTQGTVIESSVNKERSLSDSSSTTSTTTTYQARIKYEYTVNGTSFTNDTVAHSNQSGSESQAQEIKAKYPIQKEVTVYYMPDNPRNSLLENNQNTQSSLKLSHGILPLILCIIGAFLIIRSRKKIAAFRETHNL